MHEEETESIIITTDPTTEILEHVEMIETSIEEVIEVNEFKLDAGNSADLQVTFSSSDSTGGGSTHMEIAGAGAGSGNIYHSFHTSTIAPPETPDTKEGIEELCPVCGDKVSGYHYGLLTCESCKGFFKRTVQNKKVYTCVAERSCHIDKTQRKRCPFCRFQKCLEVGMKLEAVRADRMRGGRNKFGPMYKRDRARKLQMMRQRQIAVQTLQRASPYILGDGVTLSYNPSSSSSPYGNLYIKQEIQIPQVSSLTSSPDSSPSPIAVALGQAGLSNTAAGPNQPPALQIVAGSNNSSSHSNNNNNNNPPSGTTSTPGLSLSEHSKLWANANSTTSSPHSISPKSFQFDSSASSSSTANKMSPLIRDFVQNMDDGEWQRALFGLLQNQTYNQCEVDLFELMCKVLDQNLFSQVDWARNSCFFKDLKVDDQMKLLQHSWSDMLVLDHMHQRMHNALPDETTLHNGQKFDLLSLGLLGVPSLRDRFTQVTLKLQELKFDMSDYICVKFLLLLNPDVRGIMNRTHVEEGHEQVQKALLDYCISGYPQIQDRFGKLMSLLPELHEIANRGEEHLYHKHCNGGAPTQTLLMEMLHAKRK